MTFGAYTIVNIWQNNQWCGRAAGPKCYDVRDPLDLAVVAAAITGACFGFLWWNASPAKIFMGDTGSLALGGALAGFAVLTRTEFLLALLGGLFVIQTLSVILQVGFFKATKGKRLFRMAPLHHHFEMLGLGGDHRRHPVLADRGHLRRRRPGRVLRRVGRRGMSRPDRRARPRERLERRPRRGRRLRGLRVRRRRQPDLPRRPGDRPRRLRGGRPASSGPTCCESLGATVRLGPGSTAQLPDDVDLVVTSPGWSPVRAAAGPGGRARHPDLGRGRAGLAAARPRPPGARGWPSPAPTARPRPCRCSRRCCAPAGCARWPAATSACRSSRR